MKPLIWKEWRENRLIIFWAILLTALFITVPVVGTKIEHGNPISAEDFLQITQFVWLVAALLCGSTIIAPEIGAGSLQFLSSLPVSRAKVWLTKIGVGLVIMAASLAGSMLFLLAFSAIGPSHHWVTDGSIFSGSHITNILETFGCCLPLFAVGVVLSMLTDRTISALMASIVVSAVLYLLIVWLVTQILMVINGGNDVTFDFGYQLNSLIGAIALAALGLFGLSYRLFVDGETLKTGKRYVVLRSYVLPPVVIIGALCISWQIIRG
jgi:ABC-type transport system involved in multi-copper enzyme maturation permease subunit